MLWVKCVVNMSNEKLNIGLRVTGDGDERHGILDPNPYPWSVIIDPDPWSWYYHDDRLRGGRKRKKKRRRRIVPRSHQWPIKQFDDHERSQSLHIHREVILVLCGNQKLKSFQIVLRWSGFRLWEVERECWTGVQLICKKIYNHLDGFEYSERLFGIVQLTAMTNRLVVILRRPDILKRPGL